MWSKHLISCLLVPKYFHSFRFTKGSSHPFSSNKFHTIVCTRHRSLAIVKKVKIADLEASPFLPPPPAFRRRKNPTRYLKRFIAISHDKKEEEVEAEEDKRDKQISLQREKGSVRSRAESKEKLVQIFNVPFHFRTNICACN